jgi:hypothetical protein
MTDIVTPGYKALIAKGAVINNPMGKFFTEYTFPEHPFQDYLTLDPTLAAGCIVSDYSGQTGAVTEKLGASDAKMVQDFGLAPGLAEDILIHSAAVKARNRVSPVHFESIVSLIEAPKTVALLTGVFIDVARFVRGVRTGAWSDIVRAFKHDARRTKKKIRLKRYARFASDNASQRWLELRYGWTPLMLEAQGLLAAMTQPEELKVRQLARGFDKSELRETFFRSLDYGAYGVETFKFNVSRTANVRAYVLYEVALKGLQPLRDYGVLDIPKAAWEIMTLSFVIDWFIPIGDWLQAITPKLGINTLAEGYTVENDYTVHRTVVSHIEPTSGAQRWKRTGSVGRVDSYRSYQKRRVTSLEVLKAIPPFNVRINVKRAIDAVALIIGRSSSKSRLRI